MILTIDNLVVNENPDKPYLGKRKLNPTGELGAFEFETYQEIRAKINTLASGIYHLLTTNNLLSTTDFTPVSIFSANRPEWWEFDLACNYNSLPTVGLYDVFGPETLIYILNHSKSPLIVTSMDKIPLLLTNHEKLEHLKVIISFDSFKSEKFSQISNIVKRWNISINDKFKLLDFDEVLNLGIQNKHTPKLPNPDDILTICYTSGTTGSPKGTLLTHNNFLISSYMMTNHFLPINAGEVTSISYMPLSHCFARTCEYNTLLRAGKVGFYSGDILKLMDDIRELKPTSFSTVPRVLNRIYDSIKASYESQKGIFGSLFKLGVHYKFKNYALSNDFKHQLWDTLVFNKIKQILGGRLRYITTGSAPLQPHIMHFLRIVLSCEILEGYGSTETASISTFAPIGDYRANHIGHALPNIEFKLVSVPDMNYSIEDLPVPRGELLIRGKNIFKGYLDQPEKTKEAFDDEGFYKTGDICSIDEEGLISIIDRKSNFIKLSQGFFVSPEKIEAIITQHPLVGLVFCWGLSTKNYPVLIIYPNLDYFNDVWKTKAEIGEVKDIYSDFRVKNKLLLEIKELCKSAKLPG